MEEKLSRTVTQVQRVQHQIVRSIPELIHVLEPRCSQTVLHLICYWQIQSNN